MSRTFEPLVAAVVSVGAVGGAAIDLRTRRVPNALTFTIAALGFMLAASGRSHLSIGASLAGLALGLGLMLPGHVFGGTGSGDVKLFAALGTLLGPRGIVVAFLYTALAGGVLAVVVAIRRRRLAQTLQGTATLVATGGANVADIESPRAHNRFAYAPAIALGVILAAWGF